MWFNLILICISLAIFLSYNIACNTKFGLPPSLSDTFYYLKGIDGRLGVLFPLMMALIAMFLAPPLIEMTLVISSWSHYFIWEPILLCLCIVAVGGAPGFNDKIYVERKVHMIAACTCAGLALFWDIVICWQLMYIVPIALLVIGVIVHLSGTAKSSRDYWWEMVAFIGTYATAITQCIILMNQGL